MAEYLPPTETLPKFNEFVFDDAYSIKGLDRRVVHKAGTETITGDKTFTGEVTINNINTSITTADNLALTSANVIDLNSSLFRLVSNNIEITGNGGAITSTASTTNSLISNYGEVIITGDQGVNIEATNTATNINLNAPNGTLNLDGDSVSSISTTGTTLSSNDFINLSANGAGIDLFGASGIALNIQNNPGNLIREYVGVNVKSSVGGSATELTNGTITLTATTSNTLTSAGTNFITGTGNGNNTITANGTGLNTLSATGAGGKNLMEGTTNTIRAGGADKLVITSASTTMTNPTTITGTLSSTAATGNNSITATAGANSMTAGTTNTLTATTSNTLSSAGTNFITGTGNGSNNITSNGTGTNSMTSARSNTITTTGIFPNSNTISATGAGGSNLIAATANDVGSGNTIQATLGSNVMEITSSTNTGSQNLITTQLGVSVPFAVETIVNRITSFGTFASNQIYSALGINRITSARAAANANIIEATGAGGGNALNATSGANSMTAGTTNTLTATTSNTLSSGGTNFITGTTNGSNNITSNGTGTNSMTSGTTNTLTATTSNTLSSGGTNFITGTTNGSNNITSNGTGTNSMTSGTTNTLTATTSNTLSSGGTNFITGTTNGSNTITANGTGNNTIRAAGTGSNTIRGDIFLVESSAGADNISVNGTTTTLTNTTFSSDHTTHTFITGGATKLSINSTTGSFTNDDVSISASASAGILNLNATAGAGEVKINTRDLTITATRDIYSNATGNNTISGTNIYCSGAFHSANFYRIGTSASNVPICSWQVLGTATANDTASYMVWTPSYGATSTNGFNWYVFPFRVVLYAAVLMFDSDATATGNVVLTFNTKTSNAGASSVKRTQTIAWASDTTTNYAQYNLMTGTTADNTYAAGDFLYLDYTGAPAANEWGIILYGYQA